mgnify:CR=1 FL=1|jgi:UDP-3-O-[3-hydroxymyristoyl] glucosamine N-acyltransferase
MNVNIDFKILENVVEGERSLNHVPFLVKNIKSLETAGKNDVAFLFDPEDNSVFPQLSLDKIKNSNAGVIVASKPWVDGKNYILVSNPLRSLEKVINFVEEKDDDKKSLIHETVVIEKNVSIGDGTRIGAHVFIEKNCTIGKNVRIFSGAQILKGTIIGDHTIIHSGVVIGSDGFGYRVMKTGLYKVPQIGIVRIGSHAEIGANTCIDRAANEETVIGNGVKIDNLVQIAHNVRIGDSTAILAQTAIAGSVKIGVGCQIGGQVAIRDHITIGNGVKIVSKSAVMQNLKDGEVVAGIPSMPFAKWKRWIVALYRVPEMLKMAKDLQPFIDSQKKKVSFWKKLFNLKNK